MRSCVTRPAWTSSFKWNDRLLGGRESSSASTPGVAPSAPATTSERKTCRRIGWASAARALTTSFSSILRILWKYGSLSSGVLLFHGCQREPAAGVAAERLPASAYDNLFAAAI